MELFISKIIADAMLDSITQETVFIPIALIVLKTAMSAKKLMS